MRIIWIYFFRSTHQTCSIKKVFLKISQNSQENTCTRVSFFKKNLRTANFQNFKEHLFLQNTFDGCFCTWLPDIQRKVIVEGAGSLSRCKSLSISSIFDSKIIGSLVTRLYPYAQPYPQWDSFE